MPHSSHNGEKSSGKSHGDPGKHSKPSEETISNVGYVSHRQAWAERKKKKSRDKVELAIFCAEARCPLTRLPTTQSSGGTLAGTADAIEDPVELVIEAVARAAEEL
jgi:hypothetical protein